MKWIQPLDTRTYLKLLALFSNCSLKSNYPLVFKLFDFYFKTFLKKIPWYCSKMIFVVIHPILCNVLFWSPWKHQKTEGFVMFSGWSKGNTEKKMVKILRNASSTFIEPKKMQFPQAWHKGWISIVVLLPEERVALTHSFPMHPFSTPSKNQKRVHWGQMG